MDLQRLRNDLLALGLLAVTIFLGMSLLSYDPVDPPATVVHPARAEVYNLCGSYGALIAHHLRTTLGLGANVLLGLMALLVLRLFGRRPMHDPFLRLAGVVVLMTVTCVALRWWAPGWGGGPVIGSGGYLGAWGLDLLERHFAREGRLILLSGGAVAGMVLTTDWIVPNIVWTILKLPFLPFLSASAPTALAPAGATPPPVAAPPPVRAETAPAFARRTAAPVPGIETQLDVTPVPINAPPIRAPQPLPKAVPVVAPPAAAPAPVATTAKTPPGKAAAAAVVAPVAEADDEEEELDAVPPAPEPVAQPPAKTKASKKRQPIKINPPASVAPASAPRVGPSSDLGPLLANCALPYFDILEVAEEFPYELLAQKARVAAATLEKTFQEFGLNIRVVEIDTGPVITQFELELEAGLRLSKVSALADDLAIALRVPSVRVVAPIPGKNTVGVEVPNDKQVMVRLRELLEAAGADGEKKRIPIFLGKDVSGRPLTVDLTKMPHLLIAGRTGTGKSVCLNTLILSILMTRRPDQVKLLMIDPKMVELSPYTRIPHLMHPVITDMKKAEAVLAWSVDKMEERYDLLARCGVRHLDNYNKLGKAEILRRLDIEPDTDEADAVPETMPYIVIIADEMADMMMTSGKDVEGHIIRLAQKSRAVGIHLVLATQKPTVDVITGLIKSNLPARIAFQVASRVDSRVVLDEMGADKLLGNGDMLYLAPGTSHLTRAQGTYVSDEEVNRVIEFYSDQEPQYSRELTQLKAAGAGAEGGISALRKRDELYERAIEVVVREGRGSVSLLQRAIGVGYGRAARLIDFMAEDGIVGEYNGSQARDVLYTPEQWAAFVDGELETADA